MRLEIKVPYNLNNINLINQSLNSIKNLKKQFPTRNINSIYFDNLNNQIARDNLSGISKRCKLRIRYYGKNKDTSCCLEIKKKLNKFGSKKIINLNEKFDKINLNEVFSLNNQYYKEVIKDEYARNYIFNDFMNPQLSVGYSRDYFIVNGIRITHDTNVQFEPFGIDKSTTQNLIKDYLNVLEIKFEYKNIENVYEILKNIPIKPKRFSKYLRGLSFFNKAIYL